MKTVTLKRVKNHKSESFWVLNNLGKWERISYVDFLFYEQGIKDMITPFLKTPMKEQSRELVRGNCPNGRKDKEIIIYTCETEV